MIPLTNFLLLLILASFTTYTFMPWRGIDKGSKRKIGVQFLLWLAVFVIVIYSLKSLNFLV
ncbi:MAG: hypothetical protein CBC88_03340 [Candidatus Pelagibacter sp. TMED128]|nr:MAG: hypothetical protein CBC88_03340 [Candidatus Pelagibacter sp. TMED128]